MDNGKGYDLINVFSISAFIGLSFGAEGQTLSIMSNESIDGCLFCSRSNPDRPSLTSSVGSLLLDSFEFSRIDSRAFNSL